MLVYKVTNLANGKVYIGKTGRSLNDRWKGHLIESRAGRRTHLYNAIRKEGPGMFHREAIAHADTQEEINTLEKNFIALYQSYDSKLGYNMTMGGDGVIPTEEVRRRISQTKTGTKLTEAHKDKIRRSMLGKPHGPMSPAQKALLSAINSAPTITKICPACGSNFQTRDKKRQPTYCSRKCASQVSQPLAAAQGGRKKAPMLEKKCPTCSRIFYRPNKRDGRKQVHCSLSCSMKTVNALRLAKETKGIIPLLSI